VHIFVKRGSSYIKPRLKWSYPSILHISSNTFHRWKCLVLRYL